MSHDEAHRLALRRRMLMRRAAVERVQLAHHLAALKPVFDTGDTLLRAGHWLREHAAFLAGASAFVALALRPRCAIRWAQRGWALWQLWQRTRSSVGALISEIENRLRHAR